MEEEDNKFADCAVAANAEYLVTSDRHLNVLKNIEFPKIEFIDAENFKLTIKIAVNIA